MRKMMMVGSAVLAIFASTASAQENPGVVIGAPIPITVDGAIVGSPAPWVPGQVISGTPTAVQSGPIHPYSYYVDFPSPARTYVPYGPTDTFTFQGQAYGHAYDRWTWSAMSSASPGLGRYYQILH